MMCSYPQEMVSSLLAVGNLVVAAKHFWDCHRINSNDSSILGGNGCEGFHLVGIYSFDCSETDIALDS